MVVDGFPNMFLVYGPNTNLNHNSVVAMLEIQHRFIAEALAHITSAPGHVLDVKSETLRRHNTWLQAELAGSAFSAHCSSWYKNAAGKVINNWCGTVEEYRELTTHVHRQDYQPTPA